VDINLTDGRTHQVALDAVDWDTTTRGETIQIADASSGAILDTETLSSFSDGFYLQWKVTGNLVIRVTRLTGPNAVVSGLIFDSPQSLRIRLGR
jgi:hypothetical protein